MFSSIKRKTRCRVGKALVLALLLGLVASFLSGAVFAFPQPGHYFYGNVIIGDRPAGEGIPIVARVGGLEYRTATDVLGRYGYHPNYFTITADDPETPEKEGASPGEPIEFYVRGMRASLYDVVEGRWLSSYPFEIGGTSNLDLVVVESQGYKVLLPFVAKKG